MVNESVLLESFVALTETCKAQFVMLSAIADEVAALRETVRSLDPAFDEVLASNRESQSSQAAQQVVHLLDEAIQKLKTELIQ